MPIPECVGGIDYGDGFPAGRRIALGGEARGGEVFGDSAGTGETRRVDEDAAGESRRMVQHVDEYCLIPFEAVGDPREVGQVQEDHASSLSRLRSGRPQSGR